MLVNRDVLQGALAPVAKSTSFCIVLVLLQLQLKPFNISYINIEALATHMGIFHTGNFQCTQTQLWNFTGGGCCGGPR